MKKIIELVESKTTDNEIRQYIQSWLRQDRDGYDKTLTIILEAAMDYFKEEIDYYQDKSKVASGNQSAEYNKAVTYYKVVKDMYDNI